MLDFAAIDFETANEKRNSACSIGLAFVQDGVVSRTYSSLLRPAELRFCALNTRIHGIREEDVRDAPTLRDLWPLIHQQLDDKVLVAHSASFDMSVLRNSLHAHDVQIPALQYLCSRQISRTLWPDLTSHSLAFLAKNFGIELRHHNAESDAAAAAELVLLASRKLRVDSLTQLTDSLGITIGEVLCGGDWIAPKAPRSTRQLTEIEIELPVNFDPKNHPLFGKNVVFTGTLDAFPRAVAWELSALFGASASNSVSRKTDILVVGRADLEVASSGGPIRGKFQKALELRSKGYGIQIIGEPDFLELLFEQLGGDDCE